MLRKFTLISNNICYGPCPEPSDEIEQRLTVAASGRVWFTGYVFGEVPGKHPVGRKAYSNIGAASAQKLLDLLDRYFSDEYLIPLATDVGSWTLYLHDGEAKKVYQGSLCADLTVNNTSLSWYMRSLIPIEGLMVFDGNMVM